MSTVTYPTLSIHEITISLRAFDFLMITEDNLLKPTSDFVINFYKQLIDVYLNIKLNSIDNINNLLLLNKILTIFLQNLGFNDFNLSLDLIKPDFNRLINILSAIVNFAKYRDDKIRINGNDILLTLDSLLLQFQELSKINLNLYTLKNNIINNTPTLSESLNELLSINKNLETKLKEFNQIQISITDNYNSYKSTKKNLLNDITIIEHSIVDYESKLLKLNNIINLNENDLDSNIIKLIDNLNDIKLKNITYFNTLTNFNNSIIFLKKLINLLINLDFDLITKINFKKFTIINEKKNLIDNLSNLNDKILSIQKNDINLLNLQINDINDKINTNKENYITKINEIESTLLNLKNKNINTNISLDINKKKNLINDINLIKSNFNSQIINFEITFNSLINNFINYFNNLKDAIDILNTQQDNK